MIELAISSWSLHGQFGQVWYEPDPDKVMINHGGQNPANLDLLDLPAQMAENGIFVLELCNFHLPSVENSYLLRLKQAMQDAGVSLANLLIDTGNLSAADDADWLDSIKMASFWQDIAQTLGAKGVRLDCGTDAPTPAAIERSARALQELFDYGHKIGLSTTVENWRQLSLEPVNLLEIMRQVDRPLKLCVDFGNAEKTADKMATLETLLPHANSIHLKVNFDGLAVDVDELNTYMAMIQQVNFAGHISLIVGETSDEWERIQAMKAAVERVL
ncbi:MAG: hypothetical protein CL607_01555 [Anaerolineaceae bacterium]|nr:hypothetical protein [Anaerolineaceae bacterium]